MIRIDIATLFPDMLEAFLSESIIGRARKSGAIVAECHNIRDHTEDRHRRVDDKAYGGGTGMVMQAQPVHSCVEHIISLSSGAAKPRLIYLSPQGKTLTQKLVKELAENDWLILLCGHYEGVDQRVLDELEFEEISIGDFVVTGGELPALMLTDAVARLQAGVLPNEEAFINESHYGGLLEHPLYTRPEVWRERKVPETLISGHHANIEKWRHEHSLKATAEKRPDLLNEAKNANKT